MRMKKRTATVASFVVAPLVAAIALSAMETVSTDRLVDILEWTLIFYISILVLTLLIGLPAFMLMKRFDKVTWWSASLTGIISGTVMCILGLSLSVIVVGGLNGLVFWLIWKQGVDQHE